MLDSDYSKIPLLSGVEVNFSMSQPNTQATTLQD